MTKETKIALGLLEYEMEDLERRYSTDMESLDELDRDSLTYEEDAIAILTRMLQTKTEIRVLGKAIGTVNAANME